MPKLPPFALAEARPKKKRPYYLLAFWLLFAIPLFAIHIGLLRLPFFWDELGQFVPAALDIARTGSWIPHSAVPNVHPPGVETYLAVLYKLFGYSIPLTRVAMLLIASIGLLTTFLLAIELSEGTKGAPAFLPPLLLLASPLFYTQSMMAQLDMPAMAFTVLALLLFIKRQYAWAAAATVLLVLMKETGIVVPLVFFLFLLYRRHVLQAAYFIAPAGALFAWLFFLHHGTGYWLGDPGFAHYNVEYALHPVRMALSFARRIYYLFIAEFRWIGTLVIFFTLFVCPPFRRRRWKISASVAAANLVLVSVLGGAELERYLLPTLAIFYIAVAVALTCIPKRVAIAATGGLVAGLVANFWWNPPYPFPYENNLSMVDFVRLQKAAAEFAEQDFAGRTIATAWPYTAGLRDPDYGFVKSKMRTVETGDFHYASIQKLPPDGFDALITYTRTWMPSSGVIQFPLVRRILTHFYDWQPEITSDQCAALGLNEIVSLSSRGQQIIIYARKRPHAPTSIALLQRRAHKGNNE
jgi:Glycosyltransferase family 87